MAKKWTALLPNFDNASYYAGITAAFAEVVGAGVKRLALSPPYTKAELEMMLPATRHIAAEYDVVVTVEDDLLVTPLFPADVATGKHVILLAQNQQVLTEYQVLKERGGNGRSPYSPEAKTEAEALAWAFGRLLSYSDEKIAALINPDA